MEASTIIRCVVEQMQQGGYLRITDLPVDWIKVASHVDKRSPQWCSNVWETFILPVLSKHVAGMLLHFGT